MSTNTAGEFDSTPEDAAQDPAPKPLAELRKAANAHIAMAAAERHAPWRGRDAAAALEALQAHGIGIAEARAALGLDPDDPPKANGKAKANGRAKTNGKAKPEDAKGKPFEFRTMAEALVALLELRPALRWCANSAKAKAALKNWHNIPQSANPADWPPRWRTAEEVCLVPSTAGLFIVDMDAALDDSSGELSERKPTKDEALELAKALAGPSGKFYLYESTPGKGSWHCLFADAANGGREWASVKGAGRSGFASQNGLLWRASTGAWTKFDTRGGGIYEAGHRNAGKVCGARVDANLRRLGKFIRAIEHGVTPIANPELLGEANASRKGEAADAAAASAVHEQCLERTREAARLPESRRTAMREEFIQFAVLMRGKRANAPSAAELRGAAADEWDRALQGCLDHLATEGEDAENLWANGAPECAEAFMAHSDMADAFLGAVGEDYLFDLTCGRWVRWNPERRRWQLGLAADQAAKRIVEATTKRLLAKRDTKDAKTFARDSHYNGALRVAAAREGRQVLSGADKADLEEGVIPAFDRKADLLGLPGGKVLDLTTGKARNAERGDFVTMRMGCSPEADEPTRWLAFLAEAFSDFGDDTPKAIEAIRHWLRRALRGDVKEAEEFVFAQGKAGTGKSTFIGTVRAMFGSYAAGIAGERIASEHQQHRQWLMRTANKRLVTITELPEGGGTWNSELVNALVSNEEIEANWMRQNSIEFLPVCSVLIGGNDRPATSNEGIMRRLRLLGMQTIPAEPDATLKEHLRKRELGRILQWVLDAPTPPAEWPAKVLADVRAYRNDANPIAAFIEECCDVAPLLTCGASELYRGYQHWARENGFASPMTQHKFGRRIGNTYPKEGMRNGVLYHGLALTAGTAAAVDI